MLKLMKYELIKQRTSKVIIGAILALLEVVFLASMLLGKEEIMAIAAGMLPFLASVTFVIVGLEEIITYYHDWTNIGQDTLPRPCFCMHV